MLSPEEPIAINVTYESVSSAISVDMNHVVHTIDGFIVILSFQLYFCATFGIFVR